MKSSSTKPNFVIKGVILGLICSLLGKYLNAKYLMILVVFLTIAIIYSFINAIVRKKDVIKNKYFYHLYGSSFIGMIMLILFLLSKSVFNLNTSVEVKILVLMIIAFFYLFVICFIMLFSSTDKEIIKVAKFSLIIFIFSIILIIAITAFTIINKGNL